MSDYVSFSEALLNLLQLLALTDAPTEMIGFAHVTCIILEPTSWSSLLLSSSSSSTLSWPGRFPLEHVRAVSVFRLSSGGSSLSSWRSDRR